MIGVYLEVAVYLEVDFVKIINTFHSVTLVKFGDINCFNYM